MGGEVGVEVIVAVAVAVGVVVGVALDKGVGVKVKARKGVRLGVRLATCACASGMEKSILNTPNKAAATAALTPSRRTASNTINGLET